MSDKISIVIPIYNGEQFIDRCISSIVRQTHSNIEIIAVDDGSMDGSLKKLQQIAEQDYRLLCFSKENGGVSSARNFGLKKASGDYVMFVDVDDYVDAHICEKLLQIINTGKDYAVCGYCRIAKDARETFLPGRGVKNSGIFEDQFRLLLDNAAIYSPWGKLFRRELIRVPFNVNSSIGEDLEFNIHYFEKCEQLGWIDECLYYYDVSVENSLSKKLQNNLGSDIELCRIIEAFLQTRNIVVSQFDDRYYEKFRHCLFRAREYKYSWRQFKELFFSLVKEGGYLEIANKKKACGFLNRITRWSIRLSLPVVIYILVSMKQILHLVKKRVSRVADEN